MSSPNCPACLSGQSSQCLTLKSSGVNVPYFRCHTCSLVFQDPNASFDEQAIYNADYIHKRSQDPTDQQTALPREKTADYYLKWAEKYAAKENLLEVGCATGLTLKVAQTRGWNVFGVEVNGEAARVANQLLKKDVVKVGRLNDEMFPDNYFSLVTLFDVIEHIPSPTEFVALLHKKTAPGGHILFVTPDVETMSFKLLKEKWPHIVQEHLVLFSPQSMDVLLKKAGFRMKAYGWARKYISIDMLRTHAENHPNGFYKPVSWILGRLPGIKKAVIPFNIGEMYVLAEKIS